MSPGLRTLTLASTRIDPSSILASDAPIATRIARSSLTYSRACSGVRMSGRLDDLDERHAGPVEVDQRVPAAVDPAARAADVGRLAGVLLEVRPLDADTRAVGQSSHPSTLSGSSYWLIWYAFGMSG